MMLYLHCGMVRTSTTSLQTVLSEFAERLAGSGYVYPDRWKVGSNPTHHGLSELLQASRRSEAALCEIADFLSDNAERDVLLSCEALTYWLTPEEKLRVLTRFVGALCEVTPTRCIWTLRRWDEDFASVHMHHLALGAHLPPPAEHFASFGDSELDGVFAGMRRVEDAVGGDVVYVKYDAAGSHNYALLEAFGIGGSVGAEVRRRLDHAPRLNGSITHKQAVTLLHAKTLSARLGAELDPAALREAFDQGTLRFRDDRPCELVDENVKRALHERALAAAFRQGLTSYTEFFKDEEIEPCSPVSLDPEALDEDDVVRLARCA